MQRRRPFRLWTSEQEELARQLMAAGASADEFLLKLGRTKDAAYQRRYYVRRPPEYRVRRRTKGISAQAYQTADLVSARPATQLLVEASARACAPRTITAWLCGDPAPGESALDKRHQ